MSNAIEIEAKVLVSKDNYEKLASLFKDHQKYTQTNYYIDSADSILKKEGLALRVREKNGHYEMTLKTPLSQGLLEKNCNWSPEIFHDFQLKGIFPEGDIKRFLTMLDIDVPSLFIKAALTTNRMDIPYEGGKLSIDENSYNGIVDYEVELEHNNEEEAEKYLEQLLVENGIPFVLNHKSKSSRAIEAAKA